MSFEHANLSVAEPEQESSGSSIEKQKAKEALTEAKRLLAHLVDSLGTPGKSPEGRYVMANGETAHNPQNVARTPSAQKLISVLEEASLAFDTMGNDGMFKASQLRATAGELETWNRNNLVRLNDQNNIGEYSMRENLLALFQKVGAMIEKTESAL